MPVSHHQSRSCKDGCDVGLIHALWYIVMYVAMYVSRCLLTRSLSLSKPVYEHMGSRCMSVVLGARAWQNTSSTCIYPTIKDKLIGLTPLLMEQGSNGMYNKEGHTFTRCCHLHVGQINWKDLHGRQHRHVQCDMLHVIEYIFERMNFGKQSNI